LVIGWDMEDASRKRTSGGIIQQTRLTKGLTVPLIRVCIKAGVAGFSVFFFLRSLFYFPPNVLDVQQHEDLTSATNSYAHVFARACAF
jgi:hypothetical protein